MQGKSASGALDNQQTITAILILLENGRQGKTLTEDFHNRAPTTTTSSSATGATTPVSSMPASGTIS